MDVYIYIYAHTHFIKWLKPGMAVFALGLKKTSMCDIGAFVKMDDFYSFSVKTMAMYFLSF